MQYITNYKGSWKYPMVLLFDKLKERVYMWSSPWKLVRGAPVALLNSRVSQCFEETSVQWKSKEGAREKGCTQTTRAEDQPPVSGAPTGWCSQAPQVRRDLWELGAEEISIYIPGKLWRTLFVILSELIRNSLSTFIYRPAIVFKYQNNAANCISLP